MMTVEEAKAVIYGNVVYACEKAGFSPHTVKLVQDACDTIIDLADRKTEPRGYCNECKWYGDKQVCGRCRSRNLYAPKDEPQTDCN